MTPAQYLQSLQWDSVNRVQDFLGQAVVCEKTSRQQPTLTQLQEAFKRSHLHSISLEQALNNRCLAIALTNTAFALEKARSKRKHVARIDLKRIAAGDND